MTAFYRPSDRLAITRKILSIIEPGDHSDEDVDRAFVYWWKNIRDTGGFGLTPVGDAKFRESGLAFSEFAIGNGSNILRWVTPSRSLEYERKLAVPYYLSLKTSSGSTIRIYDDRVSMMIVLHGTVEDYLASIEPWKKDK